MFLFYSCVPKKSNQFVCCTQVPSCRKIKPGLIMSILGSAYEDVININMKDLVKLLEPKYTEVFGKSISISFLVRKYRVNVIIKAGEGFMLYSGV